jgi:hypothetical protein
MRAVNRLFENMMREFNASTPLKAVEKAFPKEGNKLTMLKAVTTEYEYKKCDGCGTLHLVEVETNKEEAKE